MAPDLAVVLDCADLERAAEFWGQVLGYRVEASSHPRYQQLMPAKGDGVELLLQRVPEVKAGKNRMHLDLRVDDLEAEVARLERLGARRVGGELLVEGGWSWYVLADPDGNEFCVLQRPGRQER